MSGIIAKNSDRSSGVIGTTAGGIASLAADSSPQLGGFLDAAGNYIQMQKGSDISSASPCVITASGDFFAVTGTTNFSAFTVAADRHFFLEFGAVLTMTHGNGTLDLPGGANITTAASDVGEFVSTAADVVTCVNYTKRDGTAIVAGASGDTRNFIIDGDFTQWPEGTSLTSMDNATYIGAFMDYRRSTTVARHTGSRSTDVPTVAQSGHQSKYSLDLACTTIDASIAGSDLISVFYYITGSDYTALHGQEITLNFWIKATVTGIYTISFWSGDFSRNYIVEYTVSSSDTWEEKSITLTIESSTSGWTFTDATVGMTFAFILSAGSNRHGTKDQWQSSGTYSTSNQVNNTSSTSNIFRIAQLGLYLGSSAPASFLAEPIATVKDQVDWYIWRQDLALGSSSGQPGWDAVATGATTLRTMIQFKRMRQIPTVTTTVAGTFNVNSSSAQVVVTTIGTSQVTEERFRLDATGSTLSTTASYAGQIHRDGTDACHIQADARH
jgi:hypothetical protein